MSDRTSRDEAQAAQAAWDDTWGLWWDVDDYQPGDDVYAPRWAIDQLRNHIDVTGKGQT